MSSTALPDDLMPTAPVLLTQQQVCQRAQMSLYTYYQLKRRGLGPREIEVGGLIRIRPEDEAAWHHRLAHPTEEEAAAAAQRAEARREKGRNSVASPRHPAHVPARRRPRRA